MATDGHFIISANLRSQNQPKQNEARTLRLHGDLREFSARVPTRVTLALRRLFDRNHHATTTFPRVLTLRSVVDGAHRVKGVDHFV